MSQFQAPNFNIMPSPTKNIPWSVSRMPCFTGIVEFNAFEEMSNKKTISQCKRKSMEAAQLPSKLLITEERMAAHLNGLHISNEYVSHAAANPSNDINESSTSTTSVDISMDSEIDYNIPMTSKELEEKLRKANRITICDEVKKLTKEDNVIPKILLARLEKPCTALVLWQPPKKLNGLIVPLKDTEEKVLEDEENDNNNSSEIDLNNGMDMY